MHIFPNSHVPDICILSKKSLFKHIKQKLIMCMCCNLPLIALSLNQMPFFRFYDNKLLDLIVLAALVLLIAAILVHIPSILAVIGETLSEGTAISLD